MVIDVAHVGDVRTKCSDDLSQSPPRVGGINGVGAEFDSGIQSVSGFLEINVRHKKFVVGCGLAARVRHGEKRDLMALSPHQVHKLEHVDFSAAKREIVFIAVKDSHMNGAPRYC